MKVLTEDWFEYHQQKLVYFANTWLGKKVFGLPNDWHIIHIAPSSVQRLVSINPKTGLARGGMRTYTRNIFGLRLQQRLKYVWKAFHMLDSMFLERQKLIPDFGFGTWTVSPVVDDGPYYDATYYYTDWGGVTFSTIRNASSCHSVNSDDSGGLPLMAHHSSLSLMAEIRRPGYLFSLVDLSDNLDIQTAMVSFEDASSQSVTGVEMYGVDSTNWDILVVLFTPGSVSVPDVDDYNNFGTSNLGVIATMISGVFVTDPDPTETFVSTSLINPGSHIGFGLRFRGEAYGVSPISYVPGSRYVYNYYGSIDRGTEVPYLELTYITPFTINIGDSNKVVDSIQINIGDAWKDVSAMNINIGDVWKECF